MRFKMRRYSFAAALALCTSSFCFATQPSLDDLDDAIKLQVMKPRGAAKELYSVNKSFYCLAHTQDLINIIHHVIPNSIEFFAIEWFLPAVKLKYNALPRELSSLKSVCWLDVSDTLLGKEEVLAIDQISTLTTVTLGNTHSAGYLIQAQNFLGNPDERQAGPAFFRIMLKDPLCPNICQVAIHSYHSTDKNAAGLVLKQIMQNKEHPDRFSAAQNLFWDHFNTKNKADAEIVLIEILQNKENLNRRSAASCLLNSKNQAYKKEAILVLKEALPDITDSSRYYYAQGLFNTNDKDAKEAAAFVLRESTMDINDYTRLSNAEILLRSDNEEDRKLAFLVLKEALEDPNNPNHDYVMRNLFHSSNDDAKRFVTDLLFDPSQDKAAQAKTIANTNHHHIGDVAHMNTLKQRATELMNDESVDLESQISLLRWVEKEDISKTVFSKLLAAINPEATVSLQPNLMLNALEALLDCPYPELQQAAELIFFDHSIKFIEEYVASNFKLNDRLKKLPADNKVVWLVKLCDALESPTLNSCQKFQLAIQILKVSSNPLFVNTAQDILRATKIQPDEPTLRYLASAKVLNHLTDDPFKKQIISAIEHCVQKNMYSDDSFFSKGKELAALLQQDDKLVQEKALVMCQRVIDSSNNLSYDSIRELGKLAKALSTIEEGKDLFEKIKTLLQPELEKELATSIEDTDIPNVFDVFMSIGDETQKLAVFNYCCKVIMETTNRFIGEDTADIITYGLGADHPWSKEVKALLQKRGFKYWK